MLTYINEQNQTVTFSKDKPYKLLDLQGTGAIETDVQTQKAPFQDGLTYVDTLFEEREINIEFMMIDNDINNKRATISSIFNPKIKGKLQYNINGKTFEIKTIVSTPPTFPTGRVNRGLDYQKVLITLIGPLPFWLEDFEHEQKMAALIGGLTFPISMDPYMTFEEAGDVVAVSNNGDVPTPVEIEFNGPAVNPKIENLTTGEFIEVSQTLLENEKLLISTEFGNKTVTLVDSNENETNGFHYLNLNSNFWSLEVGENLISYSADEGEEDAVVNVKWKERFVGV